MPHFKDRLTTRKKARKLDTVARPSKRRGGLGGVNTGAGPDGVVQPDRVAFMTPQGPIHEDELMVQGPNGISVIPSSRSPQLSGVPRTQAEQAQMGEQARRLGQPGFQKGGMILGGNLGLKNTINQIPTRSKETGFQSAIPDSGTGLGLKNTINRQTNPGIPGKTPAITTQGTLGSTPSAFSPTINIPKPEQTIIKPPEPVIAPQAPISPTINIPQTIIKPPEPAIAPQAPISPTIQHPTPQPTVAPGVTQEDQARQQALAGLSATAAGRSPVDRTIANQALGQLGAEQAEQAGMFRQQAGQMGIEGGRLASGMAQLRQQQGLERAQLGGDLAIAAQNRAADAITQLASQSLAGQQHELTKQQVGDNEAWRQYEAALGASDFETAAAKYEEMTGTRLNTQQLEQARDYWNKKQEQEIKRDDIIISDLEQRLGFDKVEGARAMINAGFSIDQVNAQTGINLSQGEFDTIRDASPLGERDWNRKNDMAGYLMSQGSTEAAIPLFNELYPNAGIDWSETVNDANAENFGQVQGELAEQLAATNGNWDAIPQAVKEGWMKLTDLDETELHAWFQGMNINSIDAQWQTIEDSDWYAGLDKEKQDDLLSIFTAVNTGELDYITAEEFTVSTPDGKKKTFTDKNAATNWATNNNGTVESTGTRIMFRDPFTGEVADGTGADTIETPEGKDAGDIFASGGKIYRSTGVGNPPEPIDVDVNDPTFDPFGKTADDVIEAGSEGNPYYKDVQDMRKDLMDKIESNPKLIVNQIVTEGTELYDKVKSMATNVSPDITTKKGAVKKVKGAGNDYQYVEGFDDGNKIVFWDGELYYVDPRENIDRVGVDESRYTLTKLSDGTVTTIGG